VCVCGVCVCGVCVVCVCVCVVCVCVCVCKDKIVPLHVTKTFDGSNFTIPHINPGTIWR